MKVARRNSYGIVAGLLVASLAPAFPCIGQAAATAAASQQSLQTTKEMQGFNSFVTQAMKDWKVPGVAIAVIKDNKVILLRGYGYRNMEEKLPVTPHTLFAIGSISKSFTVTLLGMESDEGKFDWDKPARNYLPGLKMYTPQLTEDITVRDMVTHRSGLPRHDMVWYTSNFSRADLVRRLQYLQPNKPLRSTFQYNNLMVMTAGYIAGRINGTSWEDAVRHRIWQPLGMTDTNFSELQTQHSPDFSEPYQKGTDLKAALKRIPFMAACPDTCGLGPAGEINSSVADMSKYLLFHMNHGEYDGKQLLSQNNSSQMQTPQMVISGVPFYKAYGPTSYGMAFFITTYRGHKEVYHGGNVDGFSAKLAFLPNDGIGVMVLTNLDENPLPTIIAENVFDRLLGLNQIPWNQRGLTAEIGGKKSELAAKTKGYANHPTDTQPSHPLDDYTGQFTNPGYGLVTISRNGDALHLKLNKLDFPLEHYDYDVFQVPPDPQDSFQRTKVAFHANVDGEISSLTMPLEIHVPDIVFTRVPDKDLTQPATLQQFVGKYYIQGNPVPRTIALRGDTLVLTTPGNPAQLLDPTQGTKFRLHGLSETTITFERDAAGKVAAAALNRVGDVTLLTKQ